MLRIIVIMGLMIMLIGNLTAVTETKIPDRINTAIERQLSFFQNGLSTLRNRNMQLFNNMELSEIIYQYYNEDNGDEWLNDEKLDFHYDENGNLEYVYYSGWSEDDDYRGEWSNPFYRQHLVWSSEGLLMSMTSHLSFETEEGREWFPFMKWISGYNDQGNIDNISMSYYDEDEETYVIVGMINFSYDNNDMVDYFLMSFMIDEHEEYYERSRNHLSYDQAGRIDMIIEEFQEDEDYWVNETKSILEYHESDDTDYADVQSFFNSIPILMGIGWYENANPFGKIESETIYEWYWDHENEVDDWFLAYQEQLFYDANDLAYRVEFQEYDYEYYEWFPLYRTMFSYNEHHRIEEALEQWFDFHYEVWVNSMRTLGNYEEMTNVEEHYQIPATTTLANYPNPFNPETTISFAVSQDQEIKLNIFNTKGQLVRSLYDGFEPAGKHEVSWNGKDQSGNTVSSGVYLYQLETKDSTDVRRMLMLK